MEAQPTMRDGKAVPFAEQNEAWQVQEASKTVAGFAGMYLRVPLADLPEQARVAFVATYSAKTPAHLRSKVAADAAERQARDRATWQAAYGQAYRTTKAAHARTGLDGLAAAKRHACDTAPPAAQVMGDFATEGHLAGVQVAIGDLMEDRLVNGDPA